MSSIPLAIICDIDGTLALMQGRSPYDTTRYDEDMVDKVIREIVSIFRDEGYLIILCSGRGEPSRRSTEKWLVDNEVPNDYLFMRPTGDNRSDFIVKQEIYDRYIKNKFAIKFVLDDRDQVVKMWRSNGLKCLQVAEGDF